MAKTFQQPFLATFDDSDPGGIVFFGNYYRIAHRVFEGFVLETGLGWNQWFANKDILVPLVHSEADYLKPLFAGHQYFGQIQISKLGTSSVVFEYEFRSKDDSELCAKLQTVHVFVDAKTHEKIEIPKKFRDALEPWC